MEGNVTVVNRGERSDGSVLMVVVGGNVTVVKEGEGVMEKQRVLIKWVMKVYIE